MEIYRHHESPGSSDQAETGCPAEADSAAAYERRLHEVLAALPRERCADDFTPLLLERLDRHRSRERRWRSLAAAAVLLVSGAATVQWHEHRQREQAVQQLVDMRLEYRVLQERLEHLEREAERRRPVVYLGEGDGVEYVLDLSKLAASDPVAPDAISEITQPSI